MAAKYELEYAPQPDVCVYLPDGAAYVRFEDGKYETEDKELYKHLKQALGKDLKWVNKPAKEEEAPAAIAGETTPEAPAPKKPKAEK